MMRWDRCCVERGAAIDNYRSKGGHLSEYYHTDHQPSHWNPDDGQVGCGERVEGQDTDKPSLNL